MKKSKMVKKTDVFYVCMFAVLVVYTLILVGLLLWAFLTSLKGKWDFRINSYKFPTKIFNNYKVVFENFYVKAKVSGGGTKNVGIGEMTLNSIEYAVGCAFISTLTTCMTAYFCARYQYKFSKFIYNLVIVVMIVPVVGSLPSEIQMAKALGIYGTMRGMWIMKMSFLGMYFLVFHDFFSSMPDSFVEAANIDGAGDISVLVRIALPLAKNIFVTVMLINFITYWNDYQTPLIYLKSNPVLAYGVYEMSQSTNGDLSYIPAKLASALIVLAPVVVLFACTNRRLMGNLTVGGIK